MALMIGIFEPEIGIFITFEKDNMINTQKISIDNGKQLAVTSEQLNSMDFDIFYLIFKLDSNSFHGTGCLQILHEPETGSLLFEEKQKKEIHLNVVFL